jgi:hypothetical protein
MHSETPLRKTMFRDFPRSPAQSRHLKINWRGCVMYILPLPFYCLLEDDKLITHLSVTTDYLLEPGHEVNDVHFVIIVRVKPTAVTLANIGLGL